MRYRGLPLLTLDTQDERPSHFHVGKLVLEEHLLRRSTSPLQQFNSTFQKNILQPHLNLDLHISTSFWMIQVKSIEPSVQPFLKMSSSAIPQPFPNHFPTISQPLSLVTTCTGSARIMRRCFSVAVSSSGRSESYMPPGERKSGMPAPVETPAPVRQKMERQPGDHGWGCPDPQELDGFEGKIWRKCGGSCPILGNRCVWKWGIPCSYSHCS